MLTRRLSFWLLIAGVLALTVRLFAFADHLAVNMVYHDMWDFYRPLFDDGSFWSAFTKQHGPHREGLGLVIIKGLLPWSHLNTRWDAFACVIAVVLASLGAMWVAVKAGVPVGLRLLAIPMLSLTVRQFEVYAGPTNLSHGALPQLLIVGFCCLQFLPGYRLRYVLQAVVIFVSLFTGFALFMGLVWPVLLLAETVESWRDKNTTRLVWIGAALLAVGASWYAFTRGYEFLPAIPNFRFPYEKPIEYVWFGSLMLAHFIGLKGSAPFAIGVGAVFLTALFAVGVLSSLRLFSKAGSKDGRNAVIFALSAFSIGFIVNAAVGRVMLGLDSAGSSRYVPLLMPAFFALYLQFCSGKSDRFQRYACIAAALLVGPACLIQNQGDKNTAEYLSQGRKHWKEAYLKTHDEAQANQLSGFQVYPNPVPERLKYLQDHHLNLFSEK